MNPSDPQRMVELRNRLTRALMERFIARCAEGPQPFYWQMDQIDIRQLIEAELQQQDVSLAASDLSRLLDLIVADPGSPLNLPGWWLALFDDDTVHEIIILGSHQIFIRRDHTLTHSTQTFADALHVQYVLNIILNGTSECLTVGTPAIQTQLGDQASITALMPPATDDLIYASIRFIREP